MHPAYRHHSRGFEPQTPKESPKAHESCIQATYRILGRFLVLLLVEHHGFEALLDSGKSQRAAEASPDFSDEASIALCDLPLNRNPSTTI